MRAGAHQHGSASALPGIIAVAAASVAAVAAALALSPLPGPWPAISLAAALFAIVAGVLAARAVQRTDARLQALQLRADAADAERDHLRHNQSQHDQLQQQLVHAKQAAEAAAMAKGEFLATMSHEIRTPLNGIIPMLELIARGTLSVDQREMLQTADESSRLLLRIVDDILDYSKLEANGLELEITTFNLRELLDGQLHLLQRAAEHKGLHMTLQLDPAVRLSVRGDPVRLRQVLSNLLVNAIKFTERGSIQMRVRRLGETNAQHQLRFEVEDTGIGLDEMQRKRLFHSFTQADASTTRLYGGTGLGLAICKRIVDLMGGRIGVESVPGRGSTFWFEISLLKVVGDLRQPAGGFAAVRALLVTPEPRLRQRMETLLRNGSVSLQVIDNVQEALERLRTGTTPGAPPPFNLVIGDTEPLRLSVHALHRALSRTPAYQDIRMVWLHGEQPLPEDLREHGTLLPRSASDEELRSVLLQPPAPPPDAEPDIHHDDSHEPRLRGMRVLLVEDNAVNLAVAQRLLTVLGCESQTASHGEAALDKLRRERYELVLMDCQMPVLDGYNATRRWREHEAQQSRPRLPIVAMTANAMAGDRERCIAAGMDDYLSKPVSRAALRDCLLRWRDAAPPSPRPAPPPQTAAARAIASGKPAAVLDADVLQELTEIAGSGTTEIIALFLDDSPQLIRELQQASLAQDTDRMRDLAHVLKSSSANVGALALSAAASRVELGLRAGTLERPAVAVALVIAEFSRAKVALTGHQGDLRRASENLM